MIGINFLDHPRIEYPGVFLFAATPKTCNYKKFFIFKANDNYNRAMQLYALDRRKRIISAVDAARQRDYRCRQCSGIVRVRGGRHRQRHFYHLSNERSCLSSGKSLVHLQVQRHLQRILPAYDSALEEPFPEIDRIADVVWFSEKIVFEVQCSAISAEEILRRNEDYAREGYTAVWVLHDMRYNKRRLTEAEEALRGSSYYFTNIDVEGEGVIYDQFDIFFEGCRWHKRDRVVPDLRWPCRYGEELRAMSQNTMPALVSRRMESGGLFFRDDLVDRCLSGEIEGEELINLERRYRRRSGWLWWCWKRLNGILETIVFRLYRSVFQILLERACR